MQYRRLGKTGLDVSIVSVGGIKFTNIDEDIVAEALNLGLDLGMNFIDTARNYGESEAKIGKALAARRDEFYIATKTSARDESGARRDLEKSLSELRMEHIDLYQLHTVSGEKEWQQVMAPGGALRAARKAQDEGLVTHVGITIHRALDVMRKAVTCGEFESIMLAYSAMDHETVAPEILPLCSAHDVGVIIMKGLQGGLLVSPGFEDGKRAGQEDDLVTAGLRYILGNPHVNVVIPGIRNADEVRQNARVGAEFKPLTEEEDEALHRQMGSMHKEFRYGQVCLRCGYCQPCPQGIHIPDVLRVAVIEKTYPDHLKHMAREIYDGLEVKPDECVECRECVEKCPAGLDIPERLKEVVPTMGGG